MGITGSSTLGLGMADGAVKTEERQVKGPERSADHRFLCEEGLRKILIELADANLSASDMAQAIPCKVEDSPKHN